MVLGFRIVNQTLVPVTCTWQKLFKVGKIYLASDFRDFSPWLTSFLVQDLR